jgi:hypothetical protein
MTHTVILHGPSQRAYAKTLVEKAPKGSVLKVSAPKRTASQNDRFWAMLSDISRSKPEGRVHTPETWKLLVMHACKHECQFEMGLNGQPFPTGFSSSRLTKQQMSDLMDWMSAYGDEHGVVWTDENCVD